MYLHARMWLVPLNISLVSGHPAPLSVFFVVFFFKRPIFRAPPPPFYITHHVTVRLTLISIAHSGSRSSPS